MSEIQIDLLKQGSDNSPYYRAVAFDGLVEAGSVIIYPCVDMQQNTRMTLLKVNPYYRGRGIANKLIKSVIMWCEQYQGDLLLIASQLGKNAPVKTEDLAKMYSKHGFTEYKRDNDGMNIYMKYEYKNK